MSGSEKEEELGPLDDEPADVIANTRKLLEYDDFDTFVGEIDAMYGMLDMFAKEAAASDDHSFAMVFMFMKDLSLMLLHTRGLIERQREDLGDDDSADWWKSRQDDEEETDPDDNNVIGEQ